MTKKPTFTCKICGGEHKGLICTKFQGDGGAGVVRRMLPLAKAVSSDVVRAEPPVVTKPSKRDRTANVTEANVTSLTKPKRDHKGGRKKVHADAAARKRASRARQRAAIP